MILVLDNYDSFTFNLVHYLLELGTEVEVVRNDALSAEDAFARAPQALVISPGPCTPTEAGISLALVEGAAERGVPLLGVCLGHQALAQALGGRIVRAPRLMHGKTSAIHHHGRGLFRGIPSPFRATRYHSLVAEPATLPAVLDITAWADDGTIMGLAHRDRPLFGVQFHPESIATEHGHRLLANFLDLAGVPHRPVEEVAPLGVDLA
ncbi:MAG: aminodeoxychorismate/anthranilate synthase component II [Sphingomonadaceae bacterium]|uniref:anthranilate synthase component II n=1 Tax=Thermaurantiacus sp. TaxID=2820283 RepID=UPI00298EF10C|nr:aminodeoxychorismate/anthranilate synthase component II [Thermaurantiacus sp.]MCS6986519.1 aminodeoxychorismate/anthranilate synthase component II [Sphingomonadaceae bacterium]MDW8414220.1 aminodeoxychorismate/anthranilate synthase component II [Thermaurantiacus sp.]